MDTIDALRKADGLVGDVESDDFKVITHLLEKCEVIKDELFEWEGEGLHVSTTYRVNRNTKAILTYEVNSYRLRPVGGFTYKFTLLE